MGRSVQTVARSLTSEKSAEAGEIQLSITEQEPDQHSVEDHIETVNINSIILNSKWSTITANLKTSSSQVSIIIPYKIETGSDCSIMLCTYTKNCFPG